MAKNLVLDNGKYLASNRALSDEHSWTEASTKSTSYVSSFKIIFRGSGDKGVPTDIKIVTRVDSATRPGQLRIVDVSTGLTVAESLAFTNTNDSLIDMGTLSNISSGNTIWDIQIRRTTSGGNSSVYLRALSVRYEY